VHDTAVDGTAPFSANAAAKTALATPFKRPENGFFLPGSHFLTFFFCPTGDTDSLSGNVTELAERGAWGSIFRVDLNSDRASGLISIFVLGDAVHSSFDNITFADETTLLTTEDRGNTLHTELNTLDSVWAYSVNGSQTPLRFVALGRDATSEAEGEDNEPTGMHVSAGNPRALPGTLGDLFNARAFLTQQHGDNVLFEVGKRF
jgi:secreted PhoX family phosphatase